jgi:hypothetical protein
MTKLFLRSGGKFSALAFLALALSVSHAQTIIQNFPGLTSSDVSALGSPGTPPDTMGAAGTNQFVEFINGGFAIYSKAGVRQSLISDAAFWTNAGISSATISAGLTDTRIIYDVGSGHWFATELTVNTTSNKVLVARSSTADPAGQWKAVFFTGNSMFADFDTLGVDSTGVYIAANIFNAAGTSLLGVSLFSIPKADLLATTPTLANMTKFENLDETVYGFSLQGVYNPDTGPGHGVMIAVDDALKFIDRTTINGSGAAGATLLPRVRIATTYDALPNPVKQPSGGTVDAGDDRFSAAVRQTGGYIFMANTVTNAANGTKDCVHWLVLNETNNTLVGEGLISDPSYDFFYPSIATSHNGKILLAFNRCGTVTPAGDISIYAAIGTITNSTVTMGSPFLLKQGTINNFSFRGDSAPYRWGDYSTTMLDPTDDNLLWTIQEIPAASTTWGTQVTLISVTTNRPSLGISKTGSRVTLNWPLSTDPAYILQITTNLVSAAAWSTVTNAPVVSINQNIVTLTQTNALAFYRLKK